MDRKLVVARQLRLNSLECSTYLYTTLDGSLHCTIRDLGFRSVAMNAPIIVVSLFHHTGCRFLKSTTKNVKNTKKKRGKYTALIPTKSQALYK